MSSLFDLTGKTAIVTGASKGIGKAIALRMAEHGANVVVNASRLGAHGDLEGTLEQTVSTIQAAGGKAAPVVCDLGDADARADLLEASDHIGVRMAVSVASAGADQRNLGLDQTQESS